MAHAEHSVLTVVGDTTVECYGPAGALLAQLPAHDVISASAVVDRGMGVLLFTTTSRQTIRLIMQGAAAPTAETPSFDQPILSIVAGKLPRASVPPCAAALHADGSVSILTCSLDFSQLTSRTFTASDVWGASPPAQQSASAPQPVAFRGAAVAYAPGLNGFGTFLAAFASRNQVALVAADPTGDRAVPCGLWTFESAVAGVAVAGGHVRDKADLFVAMALDSGAVEMRAVAVPPLPPTFEDGFELQVVGQLASDGAVMPPHTDLGLAAASHHGAAFAGLDDRLYAVSLTKTRDGFRRLQVHTPQAIPTEALGLSWPSSRPRGVTVLLESGVHAFALGGGGSRGVPGPHAAAINDAPTEALSSLRGEVEAQLLVCAGAMQRADCTDAVDAATLDLRELRSSILTLLNREQKMVGWVDPRQSANQALLERLERMHLLAAALRLWLRSGVRPPHGIDAMSARHTTAATEFEALAASQLQMQAAELLPARARWHHSGLWTAAPSALQVIASAAGLSAEDAVDVPQALSKLFVETDPRGPAFPGSGGPEAVALYLSYVAVDAPLDDRRAFAELLHVPTGLVALGALARDADEGSGGNGTAAAAQAVGGIVASSASPAAHVIQSVLATVYVELCDVGILAPVAYLTPHIVNLYREQGRATGILDRPLLRLACVAALRRESLVLRAVVPYFFGSPSGEEGTEGGAASDLRMIGVACLSALAASEGNATVLQTAVRPSDVPLAVALLRTRAPLVAIQLLVSSRRFTDALAAVRQYHPADERERAAVAGLQAQLECLAVASEPTTSQHGPAVPFRASHVPDDTGSVGARGGGEDDDDAPQVTTSGFVATSRGSSAAVLEESMRNITYIAQSYASNLPSAPIQPGSSAGANQAAEGAVIPVADTKSAGFWAAVVPRTSA